MRNQSIDLSMLVFCNHHSTAIQYLNFHCLFIHTAFQLCVSLFLFKCLGLAHVLKFSTKSAMDDFVEANDYTNQNTKGTNNNQLLYSALVVSIGRPKFVTQVNSGKRIWRIIVILDPRRIFYIIISFNKNDYIVYKI